MGPVESVIERITATMHNDPEPVTHYASVPSQLERLVRRALAKDPHRRHQSMTELLEELERLRRQPFEMIAPLAAISEPSRATLASRYRILKELGEGGMGEVYQAKDLKLDRTVAIKELRQGILADEEARARFLREASLLAQLNHRHIATIHDVIEEEQHIFIVMEYIEGERLLDKIKRGPLPSDEAQRYALEIAEALADAHGRQIIHRDIKSANVMVTPSGHVKVLDFGLAKRLSPSNLSETNQTQTVAADLTGTRVTFGTPKYMSPEQRMTADVDGRSDIFSYGVVLCEMLMGELHLMGEVVAELLEADPQVWPSLLNRIQKQWQPIVKKCLARDPLNRYQTAGELIADLRQIEDTADVRTEMATAVVGRRAVVKEVEGLAITPTLVRSGLALAPALYFVHKTAEYAGRPPSLYFLLLTLLVPLVVFYLPHVAVHRSERMRPLVSRTHALALPLMMLNIVLVLLASVAIFDEQKKEFIETTPKISQALTDDGELWLGHPIVLSDLSDEGTVRVVPLRIIRREWVPGMEKLKVYPSISLMMATGGEYDKQWYVSENVFRASRLVIPIDASFRYVQNLPEGKYRYDYDNLIVDFPRDEFQLISYYDIWSGNTEFDFSQKYVLIGAEYSRFEAYRQTPLGAWSPYKIHASALNTILRGTYITRFAKTPSFLVLLLASYLVFVLAMRWPSRSWMLLAATAGLCILFFGIAMFLFLPYRIWFDSSYPSLAAGLTGVLAYLKRR
ncbi:MAG: protein kinase [Acidobacteria bacterium]|nr:protein kinase [Acidobacteriota bacterium]